MCIISIQMIRAIKSKTSTLIQFARKDPLNVFLAYPIFIGAVTGSVCGCYNGFVDSRHKDYIYNVTNTMGGITLGFWLGAGAGAVWPVSASVGVLRIILPNKKQSDVPH